MKNSALKLSDKGELTLPSMLRNKLNLKPGDRLVPQVQDGVLVLLTEKMSKHKSSQNWFWTKKWQQKEKEVELAIKTKKTKRAENVKDLMRELQK
ncbi:MAG: AbrB/MazE/SpoVT family DNA-binding domain-containing protein [Deltaproteobacteria bacterium]|nr:AbrB/MazE/SpoVT family DNA-binding domain-containing protein [Deltaproteobacteria bacterium]